jgi:hypothetical protein
MSDVNLAGAGLFADDLLRGVGPISQFVGLPARQIYHLLETRQIPAGKQGRIWIASKTRLQAHYHRLTAGEGA